MARNGREAAVTTTGPATTAPGTVVITGDLTLDHVALWHARLLAAFAAEGPLVIDVSGVTSTDIAGAQLLCSAHRTAHRAGRPISFPGQVGRPHPGFERQPPCACASADGDGAAPRCRWGGN